MALSFESLTKAISDTPAEEASFYSLPYVAALQQCTRHAYRATLLTITSATKTIGNSGDSVAECITRVRLETERRVAGQLRSALLHDQTVRQAHERERAQHSAVELDEDALPAVAASAAATASSSSQAAASPARHRASSTVGAASASAGKASRHASRRPSSAVGSRNSIQAGGVALTGGKRGSKEAAVDSGAPSPTPEAVGVDVGVKLLREGLARSLGWPLPTSSLFTVHGPRGGIPWLMGLADTLLSRRSSAPAATGQEASTSMSTIPLYTELEDEEGRLDVVLEWMEDVLIFAMHEGFTAPQTQCLLLDSMLLLQVMEETSGVEEDEAAWEAKMAEALQDVLCSQSCSTATRVIETVRRRKPVVREVPDPVHLAEIEQKRLKATTQKALAALDAAQASIPLVSQTVMEEVDVEVEKDATLPAIFSMAEAASVVEFLTRSTVMHRQLWWAMLQTEEKASGAVARPATSRPVVDVPLCVYVEDVPPVFLPPLSAFHPATLQDALDAQRRILDDCAAEKRRLYAAKYEIPLDAMRAEEAEQRAVLRRIAQSAAAEDREAALTAQQCAHVEKAFQLRMRDVVANNTRFSHNGGASTLEQKLEAAASSVRGSFPPLNLSGQPVSSPSSAAAAPLPSAAAFTLSDVERRVGRVAAAAETMPSAAAAGAAGRGAPRKR